MGTFITALIVFGGAALIAFNMYRKHKRAKLTGTPGCGCGCDGCSGCDILPLPKKPK